MLTESFVIFPFELEAIKEWYFGLYHPWAYQARVVSVVDNGNGTNTLTFERAHRC